METQAVTGSMITLYTHMDSVLLQPLEIQLMPMESQASLSAIFHQQRASVNSSHVFTSAKMLPNIQLLVEQPTENLSSSIIQMIHRQADRRITPIQVKEASLSEASSISCSLLFSIKSRGFFSLTSSIKIRRFFITVPHANVSQKLLHG